MPLTRLPRDKLLSCMSDLIIGGSYGPRLARVAIPVLNTRFGLPTFFMATMTSPRYAVAELVNGGGETPQVSA